MKTEKKKTDRFAIIGGQYYFWDYGTTPTLLGAKRKATAHREYWDNWQGWHTPDIYAIEDVELVDGWNGKTLAPKAYASPVAAWDEYGKRWVERTDSNQ